MPQSNETPLILPSQNPDPAVLRKLRGVLGKYLPGLWLVATITAAAYGLRGFGPLAALSPMIIGIFFGVVLCNLVPLPPQTRPGLNIAGKRLLRIAVSLLGLQITLDQIVDLGFWSFASAAIALAATFFVTLALGRALRVEPQLTTLVAAGTSVCGAAAIAGVNSVIQAKDEDVTYAVAAITLFGTLAMFLYPLIGSWIGMEPATYGTWIGLSVHEVAQVVGAGFQHGEEAGHIAMIVKLTRVTLLAVLVFGLAARARRSSDRDSAAMPGPRPAPIPWIVIAFLVLSGVNTLGLVPEAVRHMAITATPILLTAALSALGLDTHFGKLVKLGLRPMILCALASLFIALLSMLLSMAGTGFGH